MQKLRFEYRVESNGTEVFISFGVGGMGGSVCGNSRKLAMTELVELAQDYIAHEGRTDSVWRNVRSTDDLDFVEM